MFVENKGERGGRRKGWGGIGGGDGVNGGVKRSNGGRDEG